MSRNIVQVRYNLGSVKVQLSDEISTVDDLKRLLNDKHKIPLEDMCLTRDQRNADPISVSGAALLADVGIRPGVTVFLAGRYEKKVVEHAYVANGVVTPAGEQILKCPAESAEPLKPPISAAAVAPAETVAPTATATATAAHVPVIASKGSSLHEAPEERPLSPDFEIPAELMSPQVRQPDKVKKMTLFGPDPDEDEYDISSGMADANEVARLIELNRDAIEELRLAGLSEREIMEALSIDAQGLGRRPQPSLGYRRDVDEQTRALLAAPIRRTTGMTGSERRRAAQHARLGMPEVSTADEPALLRTRPRQPERVAPSATGVLADTWGSLDVEDLISAVKNSEDAVMEAEDEAVQKALIQQFEEDQMERLALARAQNEQTLNTIRDRAAVDLVSSAKEPVADADEPDFCALGFEPGEIAVQKELMEKFAQFAMKTPPEVARPPVSEANKITPKAVNPLARGPASAPPIDLATSAMSAVDDSFDLLAFKMDPSELRAQMEMMRQFERRPPAGLPLERPIDTARLDAGGYLDKGVGHSSRGVLSRPGGSALSKKLADSAVEILSNGKSAVKPISSRSAAPANAHSSHIKVLGVSASRDDILLPSADQSRVARDHSVFTANDLPNLAVRPRSSKSDKTQSSQSRGELQQAMAIAGSKPRESAVVPQRRPLDAKPRVPTTVESRPIHAAMPDQGLMLVGAAPIPSRRPQPRATGEISLRAKLLNPKEGADVAAPIWLSGSVRGTDAMAAENGVTTSSRPQVFQASGSTAVSTSRSSKSNSSNSRNKGAVTGRGEESDHDRDYV